jgi:hypothetical protein
MAQFTSQFEAPTYSGSASGVLTTGQNGWYLPAVANSTDHNVFTTAGNAFNFPANPNGCGQFDAGMSFNDAAGAQHNARTQHPVDFSAGGIWEASWDCTGHWSGTLPAVDNLGSWSMQPSATARYFQQLMSWGPTINASFPGSVTDHTAAADAFHIGFGYFTAASPAAIAFATSSAAFRDLPVDHWYHVKVRWDFAAAQILSVSIQDLTTNGPVTTDDVTANGWYLQGGPNSTNALPTDIRCFAGGAVTGGGSDVTAWDNISVGPGTAPVLPNCNTASCYPNCDHSTTSPCLNVLDFSCFLNSFAAGDSYANCDHSTTPPVLNVLDFSCFLNSFAAGCSSC